MIRRLCALVGLIVVAAILSHCGQQSGSTIDEGGFPVLRGPYFGQKTPGLTPELFAPGIVSTGLMDGTCNFSPDGDEMYYNSGYFHKGKVNLSIVYSKIENGVWTVPEFVNFADREFVQGYPFLSYDGTELYYTSNKPTNDPQFNNQYNFWVVRKDSSGWGEPVLMPAPINGRGEVTGISVTTSGVVYYTLMTADEQLIYRSAFSDGKYSEPERLPDAVNSVKSQFDGVIAPDESYMILPVYGRDDSYGSTDLYITFRDENDNWTPVRNMGEAFNSKFTEGAARITPDGKYILFTGKLESHNWNEDSAGFYDILNYNTKPQHGSFDIYWVDAGIIDQFRPENTE
ncbi:MAG: PD40 domain-containing protein [Candidatus Zixiibacteriota bacterium]|nr:MAG: PD40 domain-containing protein [candidate division Zixibacteria bacterium]